MKISEFMSGVMMPMVCIALGSVAAVAVVGRSSAEHALLSSHLLEYRELSEDQRKMVKASFAEFSIQTDDRQRDISALHEAVQNDLELQDGLERYFAWWSSLSQSEWDSFPEMTREHQIGFAKARINKQTETEETIVVDFADWGQTSLQPLHLTIDECGQIIMDSLKDTEIPPEIAREVHLLKSPEHRSLALSLWLFERFRVDLDREARAVQSKEILQAVLANVSDAAWEAEFEQIIAENSEKSFFRFWLLRNLLVIIDESTMALGNKLMKKFPVSEDEIVGAFVNLEDKSRQYALMVMPADEASTRLEFLAQSSRAQTPEQKLLVKFIAFARDRHRIIGAIIFGQGNRPPANDSRGQAPLGLDGKK
ncbi:MAG: hypothetical protein DWI22_10415 [Planctomycetota bacterium]|jgi:hypothetical protein|nr:MAG: hypothetical protein DWI22_10415 [Planctomycetota bacterium]